jgi:hypothetical protein
MEFKITMPESREGVKEEKERKLIGTGIKYNTHLCICLIV